MRYTDRVDQIKAETYDSSDVKHTEQEERLGKERAELAEQIAANEDRAKEFRSALQRMEQETNALLLHYSKVIFMLEEHLANVRDHLKSAWAANQPKPEDIETTIKYADGGLVGNTSVSVAEAIDRRVNASLRNKNAR